MVQTAVRRSEMTFLEEMSFLFLRMKMLSGETQGFTRKIVRKAVIRWRLFSAANSCSMTRNDFSWRNVISFLRMKMLSGETQWFTRKFFRKAAIQWRLFNAANFSSRIRNDISWRNVISFLVKLTFFIFHKTDASGICNFLNVWRIKKMKIKYEIRRTTHHAPWGNLPVALRSNRTHECHVVHGKIRWSYLAAFSARVVVPPLTWQRTTGEW